MFEAIPSLNYKYEIDTRGNVRNAKTKKILKKIVRRNKNIKSFTVRVIFNGRRKECSIQQLLWEVHGVVPKKGGEMLFFQSLNKAAIFLSERLHYTKQWILNHFTKRIKEFHGWQIFYHIQKKRIFRKVDLILESKYFYREIEYWNDKNKLCQS